MSSPFCPSSGAQQFLLPPGCGDLGTAPIDFPAVYFLDRQVFRLHRVHVRGTGPLTFPTTHLSDMETGGDQSYVSRFFNGVHTWLPVISEKRFRRL